MTNAFLARRRLLGRSFLTTPGRTGICVAIVALSLTLSGCNTVAGAGKDIQGAGKSIEGGADKTKEAIEQSF